MAREDLRRNITGLHATRLGATAVSIYATVRSNSNVHEQGILMPPGITRSELTRSGSICYIHCVMPVLSHVCLK